MGQVEVKVGEFQRRTLEYKRQNLWILEYNDIPVYTVQSAGRPNWQGDNPITVKYLTTYQKYAANTGTWQPMDFTINDPITPSGARMFYELLLKQWNYKTGRVGAKSQYAGNLSIKLLSPEMSGLDGKVSPSKPSTGNLSYDVNNHSAFTPQIIEEWKLENAFLGSVNFNGNPLDYDNSDRLKITFNVIYDCATLVTAYEPS